MSAVQTKDDEERKILRVNPYFKYRVLNADGGDSLKACFECGNCTSTCPIARFTGVFRPNKLIHMAKIGVPDLLKNDAIWMCVSCYTCTERCPQGLEVTEIMRVFKNLAFEDGYMPAFYKDLFANIVNSGYAYSLSKSNLQKRESKGLPPLPRTKVEELKKLAEVVSPKNLKSEARNV